MNSRLWSRISVSSMIALAMLVTLNAQAQGPKPARFTVTDIATLGGTYSFAYSINRSGVVAGGAATASQTNGLAQTAFIWDGGQPISLGTLGGSACPDCSSEGGAVGPNGTSALVSETASSNGLKGEDFCEFGTHHQCLAAVWKDGVLKALPTLSGGNNSLSFFMNSEGETVGASETGVADATCATPFQMTRFEAVRWSLNATPTPLPPLPNDTVSFAFMNNDVGQAVGMSGLCSSVILPPFVGPSAPHAVLWDQNGTPHDLSNPPGSAGVFNVANSINNQGQVGMNTIMSDGTLHAFIWNQTGVFRQLETWPEGSPVTVVPCCNTINDRGQIVGFSIDADGNFHALLWPDENAAPLRINGMLPANSPWYVLNPGGINDAGNIAATALNLNTFETHAVLLSPIVGIGPEARGAMKPPTLPENVRRMLQEQIHF